MSTGVEDIEDVTFDRPCDAPLGASVGIYHIMVAYCAGGDATEWPKKIEPQFPIFSALKNRYRDIRNSVLKGIKVKIIICTAPANESHEHCDLLVFGSPRGGMTKEFMHIARGVGYEDFDEFLEFLKSPWTLPSDLSITPLYIPHVLICSHEANDGRCGYCGPRIAQVFRTALDRPWFPNCQTCAIQAKVYETSHFGGHKFAANVITYPAGHWWGYVKPQDVERLLPQLPAGLNQPTLSPGPPEELLHLWRGRMGMSKGEQAKITPYVNKSKKMKGDANHGKKKDKDGKKEKKKEEDASTIQDTQEFRAGVAFARKRTAELELMLYVLGVLAVLFFACLRSA